MPDAEQPRDPSSHRPDHCVAGGFVGSTGARQIDLRAQSEGAIEHRQAQLPDADAVAWLHARSWRWNHRGELTDAFLDGRFYERLGARNVGAFRTETHAGAVARSCR